MTMKKNLMFIFLILMSVSAISQENMFTLGGGYSFATIEDTDIKGTGFRINGLYEFNPMGGKFAHGVSFGYIGLKATEGETDYTINSFPLYYAPKLMFGNEKINAFVKGAIGMQFAKLKKERAVNLEDSDFGFYGGGGAGVMFFLSEKIFINAEYEIAWASNSWYKDGWMNTASGGLGFRF
jgi:hypothetical protein